jgi:hypothetical protein
VPLQVGPEFYYWLTGISNTGYYNGRHYTFMGVRLQKDIGKK